MASRRYRSIMPAVPNRSLSAAERRKLSGAISRQMRDALVDRSVQQEGREKTDRMSLGIAAFHDVGLPGISYTREEIAAWAGCTEAAIYQIERRVLGRLRERFGAGFFGELLDELARPARRVG